MQRAPVSVIIPCYRCTQTIARALASIARQTLAPEEVLLVEDCSNDGGKTLDLLYRLLQEYQDYQVEYRALGLEDAEEFLPSKQNIKH